MGPERGKRSLKVKVNQHRGMRVLGTVMTVWLERGTARLPTSSQLPAPAEGMVSLKTEKNEANE